MAIRFIYVAFYEYIGWYSSEAYVITYFKISPYQYYGTYLMLVDFELQGSNDNSNWTTIQHYTNAELVLLTMSILMVMVIEVTE